MTYSITEISNQPAQPLRHLLQTSWQLPKRYVHFLRIKQNVLVNGQYVPMNTIINPGDQLQMQFSEAEFRTQQGYLPNNHQTLPILYENRDLVVINKPAGLKSHPNQPNELDTVMNYMAAQIAHPQMIHRLDQATSGAMIIGKHPIVVPIINRLLSTHQINREYLAVVSGQWEENAGMINLPIGHDPNDQRKRQVNGIDALPAQTNLKLIQAHQTHSLLKLQLATGRTHQIQVHLMAKHHPIIGDPLYGMNPGPRMMLHAFQLHLILPFSGEKLTINAPLPIEFEQYI